MKFNCTNPVLSSPGGKVLGFIVTETIMMWIEGAGEKLQGMLLENFISTQLTS